MTNATAPRYIHDCDSCLFLGGYKEWDLYVCDGPDGPSTTYVTRRSNREADYSSVSLEILYQANYKVPVHIAEARHLHILSLIGGVA